MKLHGPVKNDIINEILRLEMIGLKELKAKILEALIFALPITCIVYFMSLLPWFDFTSSELITFSGGAVF